MEKQSLSSIIMEQLNQIGVENTHGNGTDISIAKEFISVLSDAESKKINYEAYMFLDETAQMVYMYEKMNEDDKGFPFAMEKEPSLQSDVTLFGKVRSVQYASDGIAHEHEFDLGSIQKSVKEVAEQNGWSFESVMNKSQALYPAGYLPPFTPPVYNPPAKHEKQEESKIAGFCENCGGAINQGVMFCSQCGAPAPITVLTGAGGTQMPTSKSTSTPPMMTTTTSKPKSTPMASTMQTGLTQASFNKAQETHQQQNHQTQQQHTQYQNSQNIVNDALPSKKNSKGGIIGLVGFILVGLFMMMLLLVDGSPVISWVGITSIFVITFFLQRKIAKKGFAVNLILLIVTALILVIIFGLTSTQVSLANAEIKNGYMTTAIDSAGKPQDEVSSYKANTPKLVAVGELGNAPEGTNVKFIWTYITGKVNIAEYSMDNSDKGANIYVFSYLTNNKAWPKGEYKVELYIEDRKTPDETINFTIK